MANILILQGNSMIIQELESTLSDFNIVGSFQNKSDADDLLSSDTSIDVAIISAKLQTSSKDWETYPVPQLTRELLHQRPHMKIMILSAASYTKFLLNYFFDKGVSAYFDKSDSWKSEDLSIAINTIMNGDVFMSPSPKKLLESHS